MKSYTIHAFVMRDCHCPARRVAQQQGRFYFTPIHKGYVFPDSEGVPRRDDGRPFVWVDCPWCGGQLMTGEP